MNNTLELLRNALLVTLIVILVVVLYKRLLKLLRREEIQTRYPALSNSITWDKSGSTATISLTTQRPMYVIIDIHDQHNNKVLTVAEEELTPGVHEFIFRRSDLLPGRYYYKVSSPSEEASQYFTIE